MPAHSWNGHSIEVRSYADRRMLWFGVSVTVRVDGVDGHRSPDRFEGLRTVVPFEIRDGGTVHRGRVESVGPCSVLRTAYRVVVEDQEVAKGVVRARNWRVTYGLLLGGTLLVLLLRWLVRRLHGA